MNTSAYKKNFLKDLIYLAHTKPVSKQTIKGLFRFALEPLLEANNQKAVVMIRMFDTSELEGVLKRLKFNQAEVYSFCDGLECEINCENLEKEPIWEETEFLVILSPRYSAVLLWDYSTEDVEDRSCVYYLLNSRDANNVIRLISTNSQIDLNRYITEFTPERRSNGLLNSFVHKLIDYADNNAEEALLSKAENNILESSEELLERYEYISNKAKMISHEINNHLSVIDLYSKIIEKRLDTIKEKDSKDSVKNGVACIKKSKESVRHLLNELRTMQGANLESVKLNDLLTVFKNLVTPRVEEKNAEIKIKNELDCKILADENKFLNVLINLVYNSLDSLDSLGKDSCKIEITTETDKNNMVKIKVKDNGCGIPKGKQELIFNEGYSSKLKGTDTGSGLGLYISKNSMQEQYGDLNLVESNEKGTTFEILIPRL